MHVCLCVLHLQTHGFDGMVLEVWSQLGGRFNRHFYMRTHTHTNTHTIATPTTVFDLLCTS